MRVRGVSLLEVVIVMLLLSVVLLSVAQLFGGYSRVLTHSRGRDRNLEAIRVGLDRIRSELSQAIQVDSLSPDLVFQKIDPTANRLPAAPLPVGAPWNPYDPSFLAVIRYEIDGERLERSVTQGDGTSDEEVVAVGVTGLTVTETGGNYRVTISVREARRYVDVTTEVFRWRR